MSMPSSTACGSPSMMEASMNAPGSPSSPLQMMYLSSPGEAARELPLQPVGKPAPPRPRRPEASTSSMICLRRHRRERLARGLVAAPRQVLVQALRVDDADVAQRDALLRLVERDVVGAGDALARGRVDVEQLLDDLPAGEVLLDHGLDVLDLEPRVVRVAVRHDGQRPLGAQAVTADDADLDLVLQAGLGDLGDELVLDLQGAGEHAGGAGADPDPAPAVGAGRPRP